MVRLRCCKVDRNEVNPISAILNFACACLIVGAIFNEWLILEDSGNNADNTDVYSKELLNLLNNESTVSECDSIGSQLFLLPAKFTVVKHNGTNHIFYHYDNMVFIDCISPPVADFFYIITAFCFVNLSISLFASLLHSMSPPLPFFGYLRTVTALEIIVCVLISLLFLLTVAAKTQVEDLQRYTGQNKSVRSGLSVFMLIGGVVATMNAAVVSQLRQRQIRMARRVENKRLMCRPLRSRREIPPQNELNTQPIAELEHYLLEPGLRRDPSVNTISTTCAEELSTDVDHGDGHETSE